MGGPIDKMSPAQLFSLGRACQFFEQRKRNPNDESPQVLYLAVDQQIRDLWSEFVDCNAISSFVSTFGTIANGRKTTMNSSSSLPQAVLVPYPAQGDVTPLLQLARGFFITFVNTEYNRRRLVRSRGSGPCWLIATSQISVSSVPAVNHAGADQVNHANSERGAMLCLSVLHEHCYMSHDSSHHQGG
jgi:hypothetical protein